MGEMMCFVYEFAFIVRFYRYTWRSFFDRYLGVSIKVHRERAQAYKIYKISIYNDIYINLSCKT